MAVTAIAAPFIIASSGRDLRSVALGSNRVGISNHSAGGTILWETDLHGLAAFVMSRGIPVVLAMAAAWYVRRQLNSRACGPVPLASLLSLAMVLRLVFESNLFGYYFMATAVALILLGVAAGKLSGQLLVWLGLVTLVFNPVNWTVQADNHSSGVLFYESLPVAVLLVILCRIVQLAIRRRCHWYLVATPALIAVAIARGGWVRCPYGQPFPLWLWQVLLVTPALYLAVQPYIARHLNLDYGPAVPGVVTRNDA